LSLSSIFILAAVLNLLNYTSCVVTGCNEGPTPVSALLHSATMVTAGIFLILRSTIIFSAAPKISLLIAIMGFSTALIASFIGLMQYDIKKIIAYSTCSQLGFMMFATGLGNYSFAFFHLINHAFFKALLFLCAGSVIHATNEQDIRKMGGLRYYLPITYATMLLASLSLSGFPFLSGYYSKDFLLLSTYATFDKFTYPIFFLIGLSTLLSSFYSFRLIYYVFWGTKRLKNKKAHVAESSFFTYIPLIILAIFSTFSGYLLKDLIVQQSSTYIFVSLPIKDPALEFEFIPDFFKYIPTIFSLLGILGVFFVYYIARKQSYFLYKKYLMFWMLLNKKLYVDGILNHFIGEKFTKASLETTYALLDKGILERFGPSGISFTIEKSLENFDKIENSIVIYKSFLVILFFIAILLSSIIFGEFFVVFLLVSTILLNHLYYKKKIN